MNPEPPLEEFLTMIAERDLDQHGYVFPREDVQDRLSVAIEELSGCKCAHLMDAPAELLRPERFMSGKRSVFVRATLQAVEMAARVLRELSAKRFELVFTGDPNRSRDTQIQFRVRFE